MVLYGGSKKYMGYLSTKSQSLRGRRKSINFNGSSQIAPQKRPKFFQLEEEHPAFPHFRTRRQNPIESGRSRRMFKRRRRGWYRKRRDFLVSVRGTQKFTFGRLGPKTEKISIWQRKRNWGKEEEESINQKVWFVLAHILLIECTLYSTVQGVPKRCTFYKRLLRKMMEG